MPNLLNHWGSVRTTDIFQGTRAEHVGQAFLELAAKHGSSNVYPGAAIRRARLRGWDERKKERRLAKRHAPAADWDDNDLRLQKVEPSPDVAAQAKECAIEVQCALKRLPASVAQAIRQCVMLGMAASELAADIGCSSRTI